MNFSQISQVTTFNTKIGQEVESSIKNFLLVVILPLFIAADFVQVYFIEDYRIGYTIRFALGIAAMLVYITFGGIRLWRPLINVGPAKGWRFWSKFLIITNLALIVFLVILLGILKLVNPPFNSYKILFGIQLSELPLYLIVGSIIAPITEELLYRFIVCNFVINIFPKFKVLFTILISGSLFALFHLVCGYANIMNIVAGFILAWIYLKSESLILPIVFHALGNVWVHLFCLALYYLF